MGRHPPAQGRQEHPGRGEIDQGRPARDTDPIYAIMDNLSANKTPAIRTWAAAAHVELCFTPTNSSWGRPGLMRSATPADASSPEHDPGERPLLVPTPGSWRRSCEGINLLRRFRFGLR